MFNHFTKHLKSVRYPKKQETWDVSGILGNERYNFDIRRLDEPQKFTTATKATKLVFDLPTKFVIVDSQELHAHIFKNKITYLILDYIVKELEWNIILDK